MAGDTHLWSLLDEENLAVGKTRDYHPKARFLPTWGVEQEYEDSDQNLMHQEYFYPQTDKSIRAHGEISK